MSTTLTLQPAESTSVDCYIANGAYTGTAFDSTPMIIGTVTTVFNRALLKFDFSSLPDGAVIESVTLTITHSGSAGITGTPTFTCYRLTQTAITESATWNRYDGTTLWSTVGGDYTATNSDAFTFTGSTLVFDDLKAMLRDARSATLTDLAVVIIGPESSGDTNYVTAYDSSDGTASNRPKLEIVYSLPVHMQIANAAKTVIENLTLPELEAANIIVRKVPARRGGQADPLPMVSLSTEKPVSYAAATNASDYVTYPITVTLWNGSNGNLTDDHGLMLQWRQRIRDAFHQQRLSGVDSVFNCQIPSSAPFNQFVFAAGNLDYSQMQLNFISREQRGL